MKVKSYPKWATFVFALSALGWIVMIVIDLVTKQESKILFYAHIALAAVYAVCTVVYAIQYGMSKHAKNKHIAAQEAAKQEAAKQAAVQEAFAQQQAAAQQAAAQEAAAAIQQEAQPNA